jgi:toxin ParE1/3/4
MKTTVLWTERARRDLFEIGDFIGRDKPEAAARWTTQLIAAVDRTALFPASGRIVPEIDRSDIREVVLGIYRIVYQLKGSSMAILAVFESHRLLDGSFVYKTDRG